MTATNGYHTPTLTLTSTPAAQGYIPQTISQDFLEPVPIRTTPPTTITDPASFAAAALKHITTSAIDKRTILRAQLSQYKTTRNDLEAKFQPIQTAHELQCNTIRKREIELEIHIKQLDDYLEGCEMVSQLSHDVAKIVPVVDPHSKSKPVKLDETKPPRIKRNPEDRLCDADVVDILRKNMNQPMSSLDIIKACPDNKRGAARQGIWMSLNRLVKAGTIRNPKPGEWLYPQEAPPVGMMVVTAKVAKETIAAKTSKKMASVSTLSAALERPTVTKLVIESRERAARNNETSLGNALKKAGVRSGVRR